VEANIAFAFQRGNLRDVVVDVVERLRGKQGG